MSSLGLPHLERYWQRSGAARAGGSAENGSDAVADHILLSGLGLGLEETIRYLFQDAPTLAQFQAWVLERNGGTLDAARVARINRAIAGDPELRSALPDPVFTASEMAFWDEHGYVTLHDAAPPADIAAAARAIFEFLDADPAQPETWYGNPRGHSIWVNLLRHPALWATRNSPRIYRAFAQLWQRGDLWATIDQAGLNPPERPGWSFPGPRLHWDTSLDPPIPFGTQGILYLTDTAPHQGAFTCVPGFHRSISQWLAHLPEGADPRAQDLEKLGAIPIAGRAGDLVIWHHALPHGASPNRAAAPRVVQYLNLRPSEWEQRKNWR